MLRAVTVLCVFGVAVLAQSPTPATRDIPVSIRMPQSPLIDLVKLYQSITHRKVWLDAELRFDHRVSVSTDHPLPRVEAISLIRGALRKEGVEIREVGDSEAYVSRVAP
jgi:hypothetical protein